jgi:hypothetical protein
MSAALSKALAAGELKVRKASSGEAIIVFRNPVAKTDEAGNRYSVTLTPVRITHGNVIDLFERQEVDKEAVKQSNVRNLIQMGVLEVV